MFFLTVAVHIPPLQTFWHVNCPSGTSFPLEVKMQKLTQIEGNYVTVTSLQKAEDTMLTDAIMSAPKAREICEMRLKQCNL